MSPAVPAHAPGRARRLVAATALVLGGAVLAGCAGSDAGDRLLVTAAAGDGAADGTIWAVDPGEPLGDDAVVARGASQPLGVTTTDPEGTSWTNPWGRDWSGELLMSWATRSEAQVTVGRPGDEPRPLLTSGSRVLSRLLTRGLFTQTREGCALTRSPSADVDPVGTGFCAISEDDRWVVSWPTPVQDPTGGVGPGDGVLTIRDLRSGEDRPLPDLAATNAVALGRDARVLATVPGPDGVQGVVVDARTGAEVGRTPTYPDLQVQPVAPGATGFTAVADGGTVLLWISTGAEVTEVDRGLQVVPVTTGSRLHYLRLDAAADADSVRRWEPGGEAEELLTGVVGAAAVDPSTIIATRQNGPGVELYTEAASHELERRLTIPVGADEPALVESVLVQGERAFLVIAAGGGVESRYLARLELHGDGSIVALRDVPGVGVEALDHDGTALISTRTAPDGPVELQVLRPSEKAPTVRATAARTGVSLIHSGVVYFTAAEVGGEPEVRSVRAAGDPEPKVLYPGVALVGATWPEEGEAESVFLYSRATLAAAAAAQQQQP